jgi:hypothetical protein
VRLFLTLVGKPAVELRTQDPSGRTQNPWRVARKHVDFFAKNCMVIQYRPRAASRGTSGYEPGTSCRGSHIRKFRAPLGAAFLSG